MLGPVSSHAAAETRQVVASLGSQPTVAGHSGDHPPDLETLRATPARPHQILIQGILCGGNFGPSPIVEGLMKTMHRIQMGIFASVLVAVAGCSDDDGKNRSQA